MTMQNASVPPSATESPLPPLAPERPEHPDGIATVLRDRCHVNNPNAMARVESTECGLRVLTMFLQAANANVPPPPPGHVKASALSEPPVPLAQLNEAADAAQAQLTADEERRQQRMLATLRNESRKMVFQ